MAYSTGDNHKMRLLFDCSVTVFISLGNCLFNFDNLFNFNVFQNQENVCFFYMQLRVWRKWRYYWLHIHWLEEPSFWMCTSMPVIAHKISPYSVKLQHSAVKSGCLFLWFYLIFNVQSIHQSILRACGYKSGIITFHLLRV